MIQMKVVSDPYHLIEEVYVRDEGTRDVELLFQYNGESPTYRLETKRRTATLYVWEEGTIGEAVLEFSKLPFPASELPSRMFIIREA